MLIDKINRFGQNLDTKKTSQSKSSNAKLAKDNIEISDVARQKAEEAKFNADVESITKQTLSLPVDKARQAKINEIKEKLANGYYDNPSAEMLNAAADRFLSDIFGSVEN
ncbi:MAG: flagellar biosynthesis anti-sigma factor FlgM [Leptospiraceae bacterium]|nr:flagellar biosynthesis anti-sigma factor FlgM [Leptospiraceae bacterium]